MNKSISRASRTLVAVAASFFAFAELNVHAASVSLTWAPPIPGEDVAGYKIHVGPSSRTYTSSIDVGNATNGVVPYLDSSATYYFAITAYNGAKDESDFSTELVWDNTPPSIVVPVALGLTATQSGQAIIPDLTGQAEVIDNISAVTAIVVGQSPAAGTAVNIGTTLVTITATDESGNMASATTTVTVGPGNSAPLVDAGIAQAIALPTSTALLHAAVTDDGLPSGSSVAMQWSMVSGPAAVSFSQATAMDTTVSFTQPGTYLLRLTATDGELSASDTVTITLTPAPVPMPPIGLRIL